MEATLEFHNNRYVDTYQFSLARAVQDSLIFLSESITCNGRTYELASGQKESYLLSSEATEKSEKIVRMMLSNCRTFQFHDTSATSNIRGTARVDNNRFLMSDGGNVAAYLYMLKNGSTTYHKYYNRIIDPKAERDIIVATKAVGNWSGIYRREFLRSQGIRHNETPGAAYQDTGFFIQTHVFADRVMFIDKPYYRYRLDNPDSSTNNPTKAMAIVSEYAFVREQIENKGGDDLWREASVYVTNRKIRSYLWMVGRLTEDIRLDFAKVAQKELKADEAAGEVDLSLLNTKQRNKYEMLSSDPDGFAGNNKADDSKTKKAKPGMARKILRQIRK